MTLTEKLDILMKERGLTRGSLAKKTGIPYTTIVGFYEKGYENMKLSNLKKLAAFFNVPTEYLCDDSVDELPQRADGGVFSKKYAALSDKSRSIVDGVLNGLAELENVDDRENDNIIYIREYVTPAAAGYASPAEGEDYVLIPLPDDAPKHTDFAVRIDGDSMEPHIKDGSRVFVSRTNELSDGDVGVFFIDGDMKCKQFCQDNYGNIYLFSLNRARADADVSVPASSGITVFCFGKVLLPKRLPLPIR